MAAPKQTDPQYKLRLTHELKGRIERSALEHNRSMNAEIVTRLEEAYARDDSAGGIKFDMSRLTENEKTEMAEYLAKAALVLIGKHPEQSGAAKKDRAAAINATIDVVLDEHTQEGAKRPRK